MRLKGLIFVLICVALFFGITALIPDNYVQKQVEYQASVVNGAVVEFDDFEFSLTSLSVKWSRLQVTNPQNTMQNTFETGRAELDFLFWPVLWESFLVEDIVLTGFQMETEREYDGYFEIPEEELNKEPSFISEVITQISSEIENNAQTQIDDIKTDVNLDNLMAQLNLQAPDKIDSLRNSLQANYAKWDSTFNSIKLDDEADKIQSTVESIKVDDFKNPKEVITAIQNVEKLKTQVEDLRKRSQALKQNFETDFQSSKYNIGQVDNWIQSDLSRALQLAKLPDINAQNIGTALFGGNLLGDYNKYLEYVAIAREYGSRLVGSDDENKIERYEGLDYQFTDKYDYPKLWIQNIELSGKTKTNLNLEGIVAHISSDQNKTKQPTTFNLSGSNDKNVSMTLTGEFNYLTETPIENVNLNYNGFSLVNSKISTSGLLPYELKQGDGELNLNLDIVGNRIDSRLDFDVRNIAFDFESAGAPKNQIERIIRNAISTAKTIDASALVDNVDGPLRVRVRSNVDDLFMNALRQTITQEVAAARQKVEAEVRSQVDAKKAQLTQLKQEKEKELMAEYTRISNKVEAQIKVVDDKKEELEKKKKELEEAAKNAIRNRIGFE